MRAQGYDLEEEDEDEEGDTEVLDEKKDELDVDAVNVQVVSGSVDSGQEKFRWQPGVVDDSLR